MKIVFTASAGDIQAPLDSRFGRAPMFVVYDLDDDTFKMASNQESWDAAQGAGIHSAEVVARTGAKALVTGHCGPKAFRALAAAGIKVFSTDAPTVGEALKRYRAGDLTEIASVDVEGHWE